MSRDDGENLLSPQLTEIGLWKRQRIRSNHSSGANACLSRRFEGGPLATVGVRADVWKSQGDEDVLDPPVLSGAAVVWPRTGSMPETGRALWSGHYHF